MKFFAFACMLLALGQNKQNSDCGVGKVANRDNICIQPDYIEGCLVYQSPTSCSQCQLGYNLNEGSCNSLQYIDKKKKIVGCLQKTQDGSYCFNCANGWNQKNGLCQVGIKNCVKYTQQNTCHSCKDGYSLILNQCRFNILLGCRKVRRDHTCEQCWEPFRLKGQHCQVPDCQQVNDYGCVTCMCGFYLNSDRACKKAENGCLRYERGKCINCLNHYRLKGGICLIEGCQKYEGNYCTQCKSSYQINNGSCYFKNCEDWSHDQCYACKEGFKLEDGKCVKQQMFVCTD